MVSHLKSEISVHEACQTHAKQNNRTTTNKEQATNTRNTMNTRTEVGTHIVGICARVGRLKQRAACNLTMVEVPGERTCHGYEQTEARHTWYRLVLT